MLEFAYWVWLSSAFGGLYALMALVAWKVVSTVRPLLVPLWAPLLLTLPGLLYAALTWGVQDRQGMNWGYANVALGLAALACLIAATRSVRGYWLGLLATSTLTVLLWLWIPARALSRSFF
jgi:hypothetical protein